MPRKKKEVQLPEVPMKEIPQTRDEACARLHFHFPEEKSYNKAVALLDVFMSQATLDEGYYWVINKRDQIKNSE